MLKGGFVQNKEIYKVTLWW